MTDVRAHVEALRADGDLLELTDALDSPELPFAVASELARGNGPAALFTDVPGTGRLVSGLRGGPDRTAQRARLPWRRCASALGLDAETEYRTLVDVLAGIDTTPGAVTSSSLAASETSRDLTALCLPVETATSRPLLTSGIAVASTDENVRWAPIRGRVNGRRSLRVTVPELFAGVAADQPVALALGVPTAALLAAHLQRTGLRPWRDCSSPEIAATLGSPAVADVDAGQVPASTEVLVEGRANRSSSPVSGAVGRWEQTTSTGVLDVAVDEVRFRPDPLVPFTPLGTPLADDVHLTSLVESARLFARVNGYWGVSPVEWVNLPVETGLGLCLVASDLLYAGFEWQLANTLFSFSSTFDKVVILDADSSVENFARTLDDMWVKAHPSHDWTFSNPSAPAATAPTYRRNGETGSRLSVNAAWDPQWDEEYIAPRVTFETMYPASLQAQVDEQWASYGFEAETAREPEGDAEQ